jgi:hypothetical protein
MGDESDEEEEPRKRSSLVAAFLALLVVGGSAAGIIYYQLNDSKERAQIDQSGFDITKTVEGPKVQASASTAEEAQSSLMAVKTGLPGMQFGEGGKAKGPDAAAKRLSVEQAFRQAVKENERKVGLLSLRYYNKYPEARKFVADWEKHPDLKGWALHYYLHRDPVKFMIAMAHAPGLPDIIKTYGGNPVVQGFAKEVMKTVPQSAISAGMDFVQQEALVKPLMEKVFNSVGLPPGMLSSSSAGGPPKIDQNAVMGSMMKNNPDMQKAMANPEVQKNLQNSGQK